VRLRENHRPAAEHWRFVLDFAGDREAVKEKAGWEQPLFRQVRRTDKEI
jgi:hypothetical protein